MVALNKLGLTSTKWKFQRTTVFSLLVVIILVLAACGGGDSTKNGNKKPAVLTIVDSPKGDFTSNFNPFIDPQTSRYGTQGFLYETMVYYNRQTGEIKPWLAASYKQSDNLKSVTFSLRKDVKWTDGQPFTSKDVVFTLELMKKFPAADRAGIWKTLLESVTAPDESTVVVTLKEPSTTVMWYVGGQVFVVPEHIWSKIADPIKETNDKPVATGPFKLKKFSSQLFSYEKNTAYWQPGLPKVDEIRLPAVNSNTNAILQLASGDIDWAGIGYDPKFDAQYVGKNPQHNKTWFPASNIVTLYLNLKKAPFDNLAIRQAISIAIDREELQKKAAPYAPPASPTGLILPANSKYVAEEYKDLKFTVDLAKAESLLQGEGYKKGSDGVYAKAGKKLSFKLNVVNGWSDWQADCDLIKNALKKIGIEVQVNALADFSPYFSALQNGDYDMSISWTNPGPTPYYLYYSLLHSSNTADIGKPAPSNWQRWKDNKTDELLKQYSTSADEQKQQEALAGLQKIMVEQIPTIPLTYNPYWNEYRTARFTGWPDEKNPYAVPAPTNYPDNAYIVLQLKPVQ